MAAASRQHAERKSQNLLARLYTRMPMSRPTGLIHPRMMMRITCMVRLSSSGSSSAPNTVSQSAITLCLTLCLLLSLTLPPTLSPHCVTGQRQRIHGVMRALHFEMHRTLIIQTNICLELSPERIHFFATVTLWWRAAIWMVGESGRHL